MRRSAREWNVLLNLRRIPTLWAHLSYTLSMWLLQVRVSLKITPRCLWIFTCGIGMPAIDTEGCGATPFNRLPQVIICSLFSALNSIPQISAQDEAAVTSRDRATVVVVMFFPVVYAVVSSANMEQLFVIDFGKSLMKIKNRRGYYGQRVTRKESVLYSKWTVFTSPYFPRSSSVCSHFLPHSHSLFFSLLSMPGLQTFWSSLLIIRSQSSACAQPAFSDLSLRQRLISIAYSIFFSSPLSLSSFLFWGLRIWINRIHRRGKTSGRVSPVVCRANA